MKTIAEVLQAGTKALQAGNIEEASLDAWYLLSHVTGLSRAAYYSHPETLLSEEQEARYDDLIRRRSTHIPLQHLTHIHEFMGLEFFVNEQVLIPRQDTEILVETGLTILKSLAENQETESQETEYRILDLCTGSGCILLSMLYYAKDQGLRVQGVGTDLSESALKVAETNAEKFQKEHSVSYSFNQGDLWEAVTGSYDMILSNPPYIPTQVIEGLAKEVRCHDPWMALDGKEDGLYYYRKIIERAAVFLRKKGWLLLEIGYDQGQAVSDLMSMHGFEQIEIVKDLAGLDRVVMGVTSI